jgi:Zn-dependent protease with chaperone function
VDESRRSTGTAPLPEGDAGLPPPHTSFFDEQKRRRRSGRILALVCLLIASGIGIVLSTVVTPLLLILGGGLAALLARFGVMAAGMHEVSHTLGAWTRLQGAHFERLMNSFDHIHQFTDLTVTLGPLWQLAPVSVPALIAAALVWIVLRRVALRTEGSDLVTRVGGRAPDPHDFEERQLGNIVAEISISAGLPEPTLMLVDQPDINAASVGRGHHQATLLVTRGLIDRLDRDETTGIVAHLIASAGAGDIRLSHAILAVFETFGFFVTFLDLPFRWSAWRALGGTLLMTLGLRRNPEKVQQTLELLEFGMDAGAMPDVDKVWSVIPSPFLRKLLMVPLLPLILVSLIMRVALFLWTALFLGPPLSMIWRNRRYAADAMAVQLTRNPDGLASALSKIADSAIPPGGEGREYCFVAGGTSGRRRDGLSAHSGMTTSLHPSLQRRLQRLHAMGSSLGDSSRRRMAWGEMLRRPGLGLLVAFLLALLVPLLIALLAAVLYLTAIAMTLGLGVGLLVASAVLG